MRGRGWRKKESDSTVEQDDEQEGEQELRCTKAQSLIPAHFHIIGHRL